MSFDYDTYKVKQTAANHAKLDLVWVQEENIKYLSSYLKEEGLVPKFGLCHGTRRGKEQEWFSKYLGCEVLGTEISDTATNFPNTIQWDFHDVKPEWIGRADFIYSNSLDHSHDPERCLNAWMSCLQANGICIIEHSSAHEHGQEWELETDPFKIGMKDLMLFINRCGNGKYMVYEWKSVPVLKPPLTHSYFIFIRRAEAFLW